MEQVILALCQTVRLYVRLSEFMSDCQTFYLIPSLSFIKEHVSITNTSIMKKKSSRIGYPSDFRHYTSARVMVRPKYKTLNCDFHN